MAWDAYFKNWVYRNHLAQAEDFKEECDSFEEATQYRKIKILASFFELYYLSNVFDVDFLRRRRKKRTTNELMIFNIYI